MEMVLQRLRKDKISVCFCWVFFWGGGGDNNVTEQLQKGQADSKHVYVVGSYN